MSKRLFYLGVLFVLMCNCTSKNKDNQAVATNDSIKKYLALAGNDTLDFKLRDKYNDKAFSLVDLKKNDTLTRFYLSSISYNYMRIRELKKYKDISKLHLKKSSLSKDTLNLARYFRYKAAFFKNGYIRDSAFYYYIRAEKFYKKTNDEFGLAVVSQHKGDVQFEMYDVLGAELTLLKAYVIYKKINNKERLGFVLNKLGLIYIELEEFDKAIRCFNEALKVTNNYDFKYEINFRAIILCNVGLVFQRQNKYRLAIKEYTAAVKNIEKKRNYHVLYSNTIDNLVMCKLAIKDYKNLQGLLFESLKIRKQIKEPSAIITSLINISQYYHIKGDNISAQKYAEEALRRAPKSLNKLDYIQALRQISSINEIYIPKYYKEYIRINDSCQILERKARNNFARIQFETLEITQEKETAIKQKWIISAVAGLIIVIIIFLLIIFWQRSKRKELELRQSQQKTNEQIYDLMLLQKGKEDIARQDEKKRISLELHDGVMNRLASTRLNLGILFHKNDEQTIQKCISEIEGIYQIEQEIRQIAHDLKSEVLTGKNSFISLLKEFVITQNNVYETNYVLENDELIDWTSLSSSIKMNLYRIIQEASNNINKFAQAKTAIIRFVLDGKKLSLSITDDGKGFDPKINSEGIGLKNIKQRVESLQGELVIQSEKNKSTTLNIIFYIK